MVHYVALLITFAVFFASANAGLGLPIHLGVLDPAFQTSTTTSTKLPTDAQGKYYVYFAGAAYCPDASTWTCDFCNKTGPDVTLVQEIKNLPLEIRALVLINSDTEEIIVSWRGSDNLQNIIEDVYGVLFSPYNDDIQVHQGIWTAFSAVYPDVNEAIAEQLVAHPSYSLVFTGHSLGAALATYQIYAIKRDGYFPETALSLYSYAGPRPGNKAFANWYNSQDFIAGRFTANTDIVPHLLTSSMEYVQTNTEIWIQGRGPSATTKICNRNVYEDLSCSANADPVYNPLDHLIYYDVDVTVCGAEGLIQSLKDLPQALEDTLGIVIPIIG